LSGYKVKEFIMHKLSRVLMYIILIIVLSYVSVQIDLSVQKLKESLVVDVRR